MFTHLAAERRWVMSILWLPDEIRLEAVELGKFSATSVHELVVISVHWPHDLLMVQNGAHAGHVRREACRLACCWGVVPWVRAVTENHCLLLDHRTLMLFKRSSSEIRKVGIGVDIGGFWFASNKRIILSSFTLNHRHYWQKIINQWFANQS